MILYKRTLLVSFFYSLTCYSAAADRSSAEQAQVIDCLQKLFIQVHDDNSDPAKKEFISLRKWLQINTSQQVPENKRVEVTAKNARSFYSIYGQYEIIRLAAMGNRAFLASDIISLKSLLYILTGRFLQKNPQDSADFEKIKFQYPLFSQILFADIFAQSHVAEQVKHLQAISSKQTFDWSFKDMAGLVTLAEKISSGESLEDNDDSFFSEKALPFIKNLVQSHKAEILKLAAVAAKGAVAASWCVLL